MSIAEVLQGARSWHIEQSHVLDGLAMIPTGVVHCCVTSIPYWGLRSYGTPPVVWGGDNPDCRHEWGATERAYNANRLPGPNGVVKNTASRSVTKQAGNFCSLCGAWRGELGLEPDPALFVEHIVEIFREVKRVLHPSGVLFLNIGDSYVAGSTGRQDITKRNGQYAPKTQAIIAKGGRYRVDNMRKDTGRHFGALPPKSLMMMPARVAIALQEDGWLLRSEITWCKRAPMPESCQDRPTSATEKIYLFAKQGKYFYDADAVRIKTGNETSWEQYLTEGQGEWGGNFVGGVQTTHRTGAGKPVFTHPNGRNMWNYWLLSPEPFPAAHFATFPTEIPRRAILAGSSERGVCPKCLSPWRREVEREQAPRPTSGPTRGGFGLKRADAPGAGVSADSIFRTNIVTTSITTGWRPTCKHQEAYDFDPLPSLVLDPFAGSGTTLLVANRLGRRAIGFDLQPDYVAMARERITNDAPLSHWVEEQEREQQMSMELGA